jgi:small subunit ribosomal protein S6
MFRYEILILTIPEITKDEASTLEFQVDKLINSFKGSIISFERWGKYRLAYPVRKNDYGVYFLVRFEAEDKHAIVKDLNTLFSVKFSDIVMRSLVSRLDANQSLEYQKPPSLEDTPKRHISSFLEEKGLLRKGRRPVEKKEAEKEPQETPEKVVEPEQEKKAAEVEVPEQVAASQETEKTETEATKEV